MQNPINYFSLKANLFSELGEQLEAYNRSLQNDDLTDVRRGISLRIVELENTLINLNQGSSSFYIYS